MLYLYYYARDKNGISYVMKNDTHMMDSGKPLLYSNKMYPFICNFVADGSDMTISICRALFTEFIEIY